MSSWNTITLGITFGRSGHMPTVGHTRQRKTPPTLTTSSGREIYRACAEWVLHMPPVVRHRCRKNTPPQLQLHSDTVERKRTHHTRWKDRLLMKPSPRSKLFSPHHCCQTPRGAPDQLLICFLKQQPNKHSRSILLFIIFAPQKGRQHGDGHVPIKAIDPSRKWWMSGAYRNALHYRKNCSCRATVQCRAAPHGKEFFAMCVQNHARQRMRARQRLNIMHDIVPRTAKPQNYARQR
jgi:hypothetical protein